MSELSKKARELAEDKAERLTRTPKGDVDASGWREPLGEKGGIQTGPRPVSRPAFRAGGKVTGSKAIMHAGRKPRASGGMTANDFMNRDMKAANQQRDGEKHIGGMKKGGRAHKMVGGPMMGRPATPMAPASGVAPGRQMPMARPGTMMRASGGKAEHGKECRCGKCSGGSAYASGGGVLDGGTRPMGGRMARASGGKAKKGMNVNIVIAPQGGGAPPPRPMPPPMGASPAGIPAPPPGAMAPPGAPPPMGPPPMARKHGGRTNYPIDAGAGGGQGRLEKIKAYGART
jgi:hypothetical protein